MIGYSLLGRFREFLSWLYYEHQWQRWEILTIGIVVLVVLLLILRRQRKSAIRRVYTSQLPERSPVIGINLGGRRRSHHRIKDLKKTRLASVPEAHEKHKKSKQATESDKLHEQIKQLQYEIIKRKEIEVRLEQQMADLMADNKKLRGEIAESDQVRQSSEQEIAEVPDTGEKSQPEVSSKEQTEQDVKEQATELPAEKKQPKKKAPGRGGKYEDFHRVVDGVKQKLCRKCNEWKPESEFHKNASSKDGLAGSCKLCKAKASRMYRERWKAEKNKDR